MEVKNQDLLGNKSMERIKINKSSSQTNKSSLFRKASREILRKES